MLPTTETLLVHSCIMVIRRAASAENPVHLYIVTIQHMMENAEILDYLCTTDRMTMNPYTLVDNQILYF